MGLIALLILITFFSFLNWVCINLPRSSDDVYFFLHQFKKFYLDSHSVKVKFDFLTKVSVWPHPKFGGRILQIILFYFQEEVNFRSILIVGNFLILVPLVSIVSTIDQKKRIPLFIILSGFVLCPIINTIWPIFIVNYAFILLFGFLALYYGEKGYYLLYFIFSLAMVLSHGNGVTISLIGAFLLALYNYRSNNLSPKFGAWMITTVFCCLCLFYYHIILNRQASLSSENTLDNNLIDIAVFTIKYVPTFLASCITDFLFERQFNHLRLVTSMGLVIGSFYVILRGLLTWNRKYIPILGLCLFVIGAATLAGVVRGNTDALIPGISPRYEYWSMVYFGLVAVLAYDLIASKVYKYVLLIVVLILWGGRFYSNSELISSDISQRVSITANVLTKTKFDSRADENKTKVLQQSIEDYNIYNLPESFYSASQNVKIENYKSINQRILIRENNTEMFNRKIIAVKRSNVKDGYLVFSDRNGTNTVYRGREIKKRIAIQNNPNKLEKLLEQRNLQLYEVISKSSINITHYAIISD